MGGPECVLLMLPVTVALYDIESENNKDWGLINYSIWKQEYILGGHDDTEQDKPDVKT
jgi:hypothetical protein